MSVQREKVRFVSGGTECAAWHYPGSNGACVIMAGGFAVTKEPGTDRFARRFSDAGFSVLAFDYRRLGESDGRPRLVQPIRHQLADWNAAVAYAGSLPGVDPARLAIWGFSLSGGHVFRVAAANPRRSWHGRDGRPKAGPSGRAAGVRGSSPGQIQLAAAIAQAPNANGPAAVRNAARFQKPAALLRFTGLAILDALGGLVGRTPLLVPLAGEPGAVAVITTPDGREGGRVLNPDNRYPHWPQAVAARSTLPLGFYSPGRSASRVRCPLLVLVCDEDQTALAEPAVRAARRAPHAELIRLPGGHYEPFLGGHEQAVEAELSFLRRHLVDHPQADRSGLIPVGPARH